MVFIVVVVVIALELFVFIVVKEPLILARLLFPDDSRSLVSPCVLAIAAYRRQVVVHAGSLYLDVIEVRVHRARVAHNVLTHKAHSCALLIRWETHARRAFVVRDSLDHGRLLRDLARVRHASCSLNDSTAGLVRHRIGKVFYPPDLGLERALGHSISLPKSSRIRGPLFELFL